ncbi:Transcriptional regulator, LysR family [Candidatus Rhodobacter oscarellae]|uniref:Transcriptional regulator, LysR family n=1 Tax=Candidatus Rhodobacter oscarellae TaxID=1675527 RepID=A0A0J9EBZ3_9RHOB|nr:LysR family transcriptional regulator [Candidatus Rhodobacter lobularis]KMW60136.1 Transcriptional regulator, LysR family [Candidatus Rhodobacter lobularis]
MDVRDLDWSLVQAFLAVADTGSLSAAARSLRQSQPTLGRQVQGLEEALGVEIFHRVPKGMALTDAGTALLPAARAMQEAANGLSLAAAGEAEDLAGTLRLTASVFFAHHVMPRLLAQLRRELPQIEIELVATDATDNLLFREADIAIRMYRPTQLDMVTRHLGDVGLGLFAATDYLLRRGRPRDIAEFSEHDFVGYDASDQIIQGMRALGVPAERDWFAVRCDNQTAYWELVRAGCGIGVSQLEVGRSDPAVSQIMPEVALPTLPVWLTTHEKLRRTPRVRRVWDHLAEGLSPLLS